MVCHCMFDGVSSPPQASGATWSIIQPGQRPRAAPVDGHGWLCLKVEMAAELRLMRASHTPETRIIDPTSVARAALWKRRITIDAFAPGRLCHSLALWADNHSLCCNVLPTVLAELGFFEDEFGAVRALHGRARIPGRLLRYSRECDGGNESDKWGKKERKEEESNTAAPL